ncbi:hypothetical protein [Vibrio cyclitrophicus]|uniref:hypothetical protein n=1 Tax=Vibrio cyclitrophicus TaxID=47951 RepID=UPI0038B22F68
MSYQYDLADFKRYLNDKNSKYRVDGLIFWQNRIPLPIDLFNRIFLESDQVVTDYIYQLTASAVTFNNRTEFENVFGILVKDLPKSELKKQSATLDEWLAERLSEGSTIRQMAYEIADILGIESFVFEVSNVSSALQHQGKKYARIFMPNEIKKLIAEIPMCDEIGQDNTDMFGNVIADRYDIYRSGFSDALAIVFNALLEFRILCSGRGAHLNRFRVVNELAESVDVRLDKTKDGSLWEPGYDDDHYIILNKRTPFGKRFK